jgi:hypothetical protein
LLKSDERPHGNGDPPPAFATTSTETIDFSIGFGFAALTYLCEFPESSTLISLIFVAKSEFSRVLAYPTTRNATKTPPTQRSTPQTG